MMKDSKRVLTSLLKHQTAKYETSQKIGGLIGMRK